MTNKREFGFPVSGVWDVRRRTHWSYINTSTYTSQYICNLVSEQDVYDAQLQNNDNNDVLMAKTTYQYDNYSAMGNMENYGGNYSGGSAPPGYNTAFNNQSLTIRGNLTGTSPYTDVVNGVAESYSNKIDIFGNVVQKQVPCCNLDTFTFTTNTYWSSPDQTTQGDPNGIHLTKLLTHDFDTLEQTAATDPNNLTTSFAYDNSGRPTNTTHPSGAQYNTTYNDAALSTTSTSSYTSGGSNIAANTSATVDGWSRTVTSVSADNGQVNMAYDPFGRTISTTNPFPAGGNPGPQTTETYDPLGRLTVTTLPDGNSVQASYSGSTVTTTDQVGRKTQRQTDGLGRLVTVTEQDSSGNLTQSTTYS